MHPYAGFALVLLWGVRRASVIKIVVVMCSAVLLCVIFYVCMVTAVYTAPHGRCPHSAPPRVEVGSGSVRQDNFVPSRRFREDDLEDVELPTGEGGQSKYSCWRPRRGKNKRHEAY